MVMKVAVVRHKEASPVEEQVVVQAPRRRQHALLELLSKQLCVRRGRCGSADVVHEGEQGSGAGAECSPLGITGACSMIGVAAAQRIRHGVEAALPVFDDEVKSKELVDPLLPWNGGKSLVKQELEAVVICADKKRPPPQIWPPVTHRLHQPDELPFVSSELVMACSERSTEESEGSCTMNSLSKSGIWRTGPVVSACFRV